jgi:hypothetical protein
MPISRHYSYGSRKLNIIVTHFVAMHPSWITIDVKLKFYQMLPVNVAHHVKILTISFLIVINIQIIGKYYLLESLIYLKACLKIVVFSWYVRKSLPFVSSFTSILMLKDANTYCKIIVFGRRLHKLEKLVSDPYYTLGDVCWIFRSFRQL